MGPGRSNGLDIPYEHEMMPISTRAWMVNVEGEDLDFSFIEGPEGETYFRNRAVVAIRPPPGAEARPISQRLVPPDATALRAALLEARMGPPHPLPRRSGR